MNAIQHLKDTFGKVNDVDIQDETFEFNLDLTTMASIMEGYAATIQTQKAQEVAEQALALRQAQLIYAKRRDKESQMAAVRKAVEVDKYLEQFIPTSKAH